MSGFNKVAIYSCLLSGFGVLLFIYAYYFMSTPSGASGGGLAGLGAGLTVLLAMVIIGLGMAVALVSFVIGSVKAKSPTDQAD